MTVTRNVRAREAKELSTLRFVVVWHNNPVSSYHFFKWSWHEAWL